MFRRETHGEEVGAAFGLLPDGRWRVGGLRHVDAELLLAGAGRGRHRRRVVAQTAAAVTCLEGQKRGNQKRNLKRFYPGKCDEAPSTSFHMLSQFQKTVLGKVYL